MVSSLDPSIFGQDMKAYKYLFNWVAMVMNGHDLLGKMRLGEVNIQFMNVSPIWTYAENFVKIHQNLAKI